MLSIGSSVVIMVTVTDTRPNITAYSIAAVSSDTGVATVSVNEYTLTIRGVAAGSSTISVTATDNNDVTGAATTFDVVVGGTESTGTLQVDTKNTNTTGTYTLSWGKVTGATHYRLEESSDKGITWQQIYISTETEYTIVGRPNGAYQYRLRQCLQKPISILWLSTILESCSDAGMSLKLAVDLGTEPAIETQTVAGTLPYDAGVTQGGDGYINIPIVPAPGVNGLLPRLSIDYSGGRARERMESSLPGDTLGYGWQLRGFSSIRRCLRQQVTTATLSFTNTDSLCLDGEPLVLIAGSNLQPGAQYRTLRERFVKVAIKGTRSVPWFEVKLPDGTVSQYGNSEDSRLFTVSHDVRTATYLWSVKQQTDAFGNSIKYVYHNDVMAGVRHPIRVEYGAPASNGADHDAVIRFEYVNRSDLAAVMLGTARQNQKVLLHTVRVILDNKTVRLYRLHSEKTATEGWRRLDQIQLCAYATAGSSYQCLPAMDIDWLQLADMLPDVETCVAQISDPLGRVTKFAYGTIKKNGSHTFLFSERPFGSAPDMLPDSTRITAGADGSMKAVVTQVQRSNGLGGWHVTHYAYQGKGRLSSRHWGFLGFDATRVTDVAAGVVTYYQYRMDFPHFGEVSALHQYTADFDTQGYKVLFKQETVYSSENLSYLHTTTNTKVSTMLPYVRTMTDFHYEQGTQLGATQRQHTLTLSSNLPTGIATGSTVGHTVKSTGSVTLWGDVKTHTISAIQRKTASTVSLQNRSKAGLWLLGFAKQVDQSYYLGGDMNKDAERTQRTTFTPYSNSLKVDTMVRYPMDTEYQLITDHDYDEYGNRTSTTVSGSHVASGTTLASNFSNSRYPGTLNNALNHSNTLTYDTRFGSIKTLTDANGRVTTMNYDPFGREISRTTPDNVVISTTYNACASATVMCSPVTVDGVDVAPVIKITTSSPISPDTIRYLDKLGRVVRTEVQAFDGTSTTRHDVRYDNQGRIDRVRQPYYATATTAYYTQYSYDIRDRVTQEQRPDGGSTMLTYAAASNQVKVTSSEAVTKADVTTPFETQKTTDLYNVMGELVKTTEAAGNTDAVSTEYTYDSQGLPRTVTVNGSYVNTFTYDAAGYRDTVSNANTGTVSFDFTALGELRQQTDAKGSTTYNYDLLRRVTAINDPQGIAIWQYDPTNANGALSDRCYYSTGSTGTSCSSATNKVFHENLSYNTDARLNCSRTRISAGGHVKNYLHNYTYDTHGRPNTIAYPSGITASYGYNAHGYLATVDDTATTGVLETYNALDAYGNVTQVTYGNGVKTQRAFAANSGRPTTIDSTRSKGDNTTVQQKNEYQWQSNGQLQSRLSHVGSMNARKEDFVYDHMNRLKSAKTFLNGGTSASRTLATTYDKLGNIKTKTSSVTADVGVTGYGYGSGTAAPGHHAITSASIGGNAHTFSYDAEGNMTQYDCTPATCEDKYIGWNKRNLPTTVTLGDSLTDTTPTAKDEFAYGPNGQRYYKKSTWDDAGALRTEHTFYVGRFEEVLPGDQPDYSSIQKTRVTDSLLHVRTTSADGMTVVSAMEYLHRDHLGSVEAVTDAGGASLLVQAYDPLGERRKSDWTGMLSASERQTLAANQPLKTSRGYTGHEHLDRTGFIHMNGRLYDPQLGRFLSPDPIVAAPGSSQSWNSYSYVSNSPLSYVDPGGQFQAGIGCNVGYVMCMNGGNTSGGGSSQGSDTATIRTYQSHTVYVVDWEPSSTWNPGGGGIYGRGGIFGGGDINNGTHGDINGGIFGDVWGGHETIQYTPFVTTFSIDYWATETRQIQNPAEEQSPASKPMGAGAQQEHFSRNAENDAYLKELGLYGRNDLTLVELDRAGEFGFKRAVDNENAYHRIGPGNENNLKFTSKVAKTESWYQRNFSNRYGRYELIVRPNSNGTFTHVTEPINMGTLNRGNNPFTHMTRDVIPYLRFGNIPE